MTYLNVPIWLPLSLDSRISLVPEGRIIELLDHRAMGLFQSIAVPTKQFIPQRR